MTPQISVIIPVYGTENYIERCVESIISQTFQDFEIIIVDDCTPDNAIHIVETIANNDPRIKIIYQKINKGQMVARETGYKNAEGKFIIFVDSDDFLPKDALKILYEEITMTGADIVMSGFQYVGINKSVKQSIIHSITGDFSPTEVFYHLLKGSLRHNLWSVIYKADLFKNEYVNIPNMTNGEDLILFYQIVGNCSKIRSIKDITYYYNIDNTLSATRRPITKEIVTQQYITQAFKYNYLIGKNIDLYCILKAIAKWYVNMQRYKIFQNFRYELNEKLAVHLKFPRIIKYLSIRQILKYLLFKLGIKNIEEKKQ